MLTDIEIATGASPAPMTVIAEQLGIPDTAVIPYGQDKAKIRLEYLSSLPERPDRRGRLILVTAISPTPAGEGKTTTTVGLVDGLQRIGTRSLACLREPSMGPVFGMKGGAAGGGYAQVIPMVDINLHFTGDFAALTAAHNLLAALIDNHLQSGNQLKLDVRSIAWRRVLDVNDRALRQIVVGLGGRANGFPREDGFDITVASELMAILCLSTSLAELKRRLAAIVIGYTTDKQPVTAGELGAVGAMAILLKDALAPNLVQTLEGAPAFVHGGPFANIAHGCSSVVATRSALALAEVVVTEAGFGADLGAEKFLDIKCRAADLRPDLAVLVATVRALKYHGGVEVADLGTENVTAVRAGAVNLRRHVENLRSFGLDVVVAINRFPSDTDDELAAVQQLCAEQGVPSAVASHFADGGAGAEELARIVAERLAQAPAEQPELIRPYELHEPLAEKIDKIARTIYRAGSVSFSAAARTRLQQIEADGFGELPVCIAKTQYSFSTDAKLRGAPSGHELVVREVRLSAGAGFVVAICGDIMTMPGLPKAPAALGMTIDDAGVIAGLS